MILAIENRLSDVLTFRAWNLDLESQQAAGHRVLDLSHLKTKIHATSYGKVVIKGRGKDEARS